MSLKFCSNTSSASAGQAKMTAPRSHALFALWAVVMLAATMQASGSRHLLQCETFNLNILTPALSRHLAVPAPQDTQNSLERSSEQTI